MVAAMLPPQRKTCLLTPVQLYKPQSSDESVNFQFFVLLSKVNNNKISTLDKTAKHHQ